MDPVVLSLALGILVFVLSYSCFGVGGALSFLFAVGMTISMWLRQRSAGHGEPSSEDDVAPRSAQKACDNRTVRAKSLARPKRVKARQSLHRQV